MSTPIASPSAVTRDFQVAGAGVGLLLLGAFGPWVKLGSFSSGGMDHDGPFLLGVAVLAAATLLVAFRSGGWTARRTTLIVGSLGALATVFAGLDVLDVMTTDLVSVGWGLWMALIGSIVLTTAAAMKLRNRV